MMVNEGFSSYIRFVRRVSLFLSSKANGSSHSFKNAPPPESRKQYEVETELDDEFDIHTDSTFISSNDKWDATYSENDQAKMIQNNDCKIVLVQKVYDPVTENNYIPHYDVKVVGCDELFENVSQEHLHPFGSTDSSPIQNAPD